MTYCIGIARDEEEALYLRHLVRRWNQNVIEAFAALPEVNWSGE